MFTKNYFSQLLSFSSEHGFDLSFLNYLAQRLDPCTIRFLEKTDENMLF